MNRQVRLRADIDSEKKCLAFLPGSQEQQAAAACRRPILVVIVVVVAVVVVLVEVVPATVLPVLHVLSLCQY